MTWTVVRVLEIKNKSRIFVGRPVGNVCLGNFYLIPPRQKSCRHMPLVHVAGSVARVMSVINAGVESDVITCSSVMRPV